MGREPQPIYYLEASVLLPGSVCVLKCLKAAPCTQRQNQRIAHRGATHAHEPVTMVFWGDMMPTMSTSSPTFTMPDSMRPVTTVPRPCAHAGD